MASRSKLVFIIIIKKEKEKRERKKKSSIGLAYVYRAYMCAFLLPIGSLISEGFPNWKDVSAAASPPPPYPISAFISPLVSRPSLSLLLGEFP
jgi:hypothetical protein